MRYYRLYKAAVRMLPCFRKNRDGIMRILNRHRVKRGAVCLFDETGVSCVAAVGCTKQNQPVTEHTCFRTASVAKMVSAMMAWRLCEQGKLTLDEDAGKLLGISLRNPLFAEDVITPRMLLSHTSSLYDASVFWQGAAQGKNLNEVLMGNVYLNRKPGEQFQYSNFGAGLLGAVLEKASGKGLDQLLWDTFPHLSRSGASFFPQNLPDDAALASCDQVLPPKRTYDAEKLRSRPAEKNAPDPMHHYAIAHGNLCISAKDLACIGREAMLSYEELRKEQIPFGARDPHITEGLGMFIIRDRELSSHVIYGHQGLAYGAVSGVFFDPEQKKGFVLLTGGSSLARRHVLADLNRDLIRALLGGDTKGYGV